MAASSQPKTRKRSQPENRAKFSEMPPGLKTLSAAFRLKECYRANETPKLRHKEDAATISKALKTCRILLRIRTPTKSAEPKVRHCHVFDCNRRYTQSPETTCNCKLRTQRRSDVQLLPTPPRILKKRRRWTQSPAAFFLTAISNHQAAHLLSSSCAQTLIAVSPHFYHSKSSS